MTTYTISGRVVDHKTRQGVVGLRVEAWDKDLLFDDPIGSVLTQVQGVFQIRFESEDFQDLFGLLDHQPDLYFKVFSRRTLIASTEHSVLWNLNAPMIEVDIAIGEFSVCRADAFPVPARVQSRRRLQPDPRISVTTPSRRKMMFDRRQQALNVRIAAAELASHREHPAQINNGEEFLYRKAEEQHGTTVDVPSHIANFTKGLPHDDQGMLVRAADYQQFVRGIDSGDVRDFRDTPLGPDGEDGVKTPTSWKSQLARRQDTQVRAWESAGAGLTFDLEGPDSHAVTMPPAPTLNSAELAAEMTEVYSMALLRDVPFSRFSTLPGTASDPGIDKAIERMNQTEWVKNGAQIAQTPEERSRLRGPFTQQSLFRGITQGDTAGPYLSQFLLVGNKGLGNADDSKISQGFISYGAIRVDQRVRVASRCKDYMTTWEAWLDVQNGADVRGRETYEDNPGYRFITTPRDLATYVHYDALYEAYLNACLIMLGMGVPFDPGLPFQAKDFRDKQQGFAQFGGPHILSLVTEVATRALKAVRYQKFNVHRRARPEAIGGLIHRYCNRDTQNIEVLGALVNGIDNDLLQEVAAHNREQNHKHDDRQSDSSRHSCNSYLLPMAFPEGSPMHPAYGAGHGTVAGACVTILKAYFDHGYRLPVCYQPSDDGMTLSQVDLPQPLTVEGELNKIASNISIGRNWAGVHYFTDYIESVRLGETIALGILEEQKLTYGENFSMTVPLFDGGTVRI